MSKEPKDKRTKAWKEWKKKQPLTKLEKLEIEVKFEELKNKPPTGLGDVIETITEATGIKKAVKFFTKGEDCGCTERKRKLNVNFEIGIGRYKVLRCMTEGHYNAYKEYMKVRTLTFERDQIQFLTDTFAHVFAIQYNPNDFCANCGGSAKRLMSIQQKLDKVFSSYGK